MLQLKRLCSALGTLPARQGPVLQAMKEATMIPNPCSIAVTDRFMGSVQKASFKPFKALVHCCSMFFLTNIALCCAQIASHSAEINCVSFHQFFIFYCVIYSSSPPNLISTDSFFTQSNSFIFDFDPTDCKRPPLLYATSHFICTIFLLCTVVILDIFSAFPTCSKKRFINY